MNILIILSSLFFIAYISKLISPRLKIPEVTAYVLTGVLVSFLASLFFPRNIFDNMLDKLDIISSIALAIIGFSIGIELKWSTIKRLGSSIFYIVFLETTITFILVFFAMRFFNFELHTSLLMGAVASATAPGATVAVIKQYKARGPLTSSILAVVGIDDAFALCIYVVAASFAKSILKGENLNIGATIIKVLSSLSLSILIGLIIAFVYLLILKKIKDSDTIEMLLIACLFALLGLSEFAHISELLTVMTFGAVITNFSKTVCKKSEGIVNKFTNLLVGTFFITGGAHLDTKVIFSVFSIGIVYFLVRSFSKVLGASLGAYIGKAPQNVRKYIGFTLLPQVGVGLALAIAIRKEFPGVMTKGQDLGYFVFNILLFTTLITEFVGPMLTKSVLKKVNEINQGKVIK